MPLSRSAQDTLAAYFGHYQPEKPVPALSDFEDFSTFGRFDEVMLSQRPRPKGEERQELLRRTAECLEVVLIEGHECVAATSEFGSGVKIGETIAHHHVWVEKCLSDPIRDSIRFKCSVMLGPQEHALELGRLIDESCSLALCTQVGCAEFGPILHSATLRSLPLFEKEPTGELLEPGEHTPLEQTMGSRDIFKTKMTEIWEVKSNSGEAESLAILFALTKLGDFGAQGCLNARNQMQFVPEELLAARRERIGKKWPFARLLAGLDYFQDAPLDPNGAVFNTVWKLWKKAARPSPHELLAALNLVLKLIAKKSYHHDIAEFKRVLALVPTGNEDLIESFSPNEQQGCYRALGHLFSPAVDLPFSAKVELVQLLDSSRGKAPSAAWAKKQAKLKDDGHWPGVCTYANWVKGNQQLAKPDGPLGWSDDVFKRFLKGADWVLGES